ncbi:MAG: pilus assembly protein CpaB [Nocardioidaceae bacterium]|nr:pilus assembly protein CpaB [Nocardioidaceae bacterium]
MVSTPRLLTRLGSALGSALGAVRRRVLLHRRGLAALLSALAVGLALHSASRPPPRTVAVLTARADLPSGAVLRSADLVRSRYPPGARPPGAVADPAAMTGRRLAFPVGRGEPLTRAHLLGPDLLRGLPGRAAVAVRLPDADLAALLHAGDRIDVLATDPRASPRGVSRDAVVLAVPEQRPPGGGADRGRLVVLAVGEDEAGPLAVAANAGFVTVVWSSRDHPEPLR